MFNIEIRQDRVHLEGYINVTNRDSKELYGKDGKFIEQIKEGVWTRALQRRKVPMLFNHNFDKQIGLDGKNVKLYEDAVGLRFIADIEDPEVVQKARQGKLKGCSFGFRALKEKIEEVNGICKRIVEDLDLFEVSILDKEPAYSGCVVEARGEEGEVSMEIRETGLTSEMEQIVKDKLEVNPEMNKYNYSVEEKEKDGKKFIEYAMEIKFIEEVQEDIIEQPIEEEVEDREDDKVEPEEDQLENSLEVQEYFNMWLYLQKNK